MTQKKIYYAWFGRSPLPDFERECVKSWRRWCPDYEIVEVNEDSFDFSKSRFARLAYEKGVWSYVSDYARLKVLGDHGGIYLDTDILLTQNLDHLLGYDAVFIHDNLHFNSAPLFCSSKKRELMLELAEKMDELVDGDKVKENILGHLNKSIHERWNVLPMLKQVTEDNVCFLDESFLPWNRRARKDGLGVHCVRGSWIGSSLEVHNFLPFEVYQNGILDTYATKKLSCEEPIGRIDLANVPFFGDAMYLTNFFFNKNVKKVVGNGIDITRNGWNGECDSIYQFNGVEVWL